MEWLTTYAWEVGIASSGLLAGFARLVWWARRHKAKRAKAKDKWQVRVDAALAQHFDDSPIEETKTSEVAVLTCKGDKLKWVRAGKTCALLICASLAFSGCVTLDDIIDGTADVIAGTGDVVGVPDEPGTEPPVVEPEPPAQDPTAEWKSGFLWKTKYAASNPVSRGSAACLAPRPVPRSVALHVGSDTFMPSEAPYWSESERRAIIRFSVEMPEAAGIIEFTYKSGVSEQWDIPNLRKRTQIRCAPEMR